MKFDPHIHSVFSGDSRSEPIDILIQAQKIGLDAIAISDHNEIKGSRLARSIPGDIIVVPSIEISTEKGHMLGLGVDEIIPKGLSAVETVDRIHDAGGLAIVPHPFSYYRHGLFCNVDSNLGVDGVETKNARYIFGYSNKQAQTLAERKRLARLGASDSHFLESIGDAYTEVNTKGYDSVDGILKAIKHRRCRAMGHGTSNFLVAKEVFVKKVLRRYPKRDE
ncbi:PHP domain-containing protein [Methanobrevibacter ruminantium M1]|uniref:PHP domain-containing protein n=1 Tax=Methanobrevibacter ruminantium (strain ATCC 35063 / DSM 1093 / JCM 13430 / OCM 146 / M1) TaxID=634498 RepID=D3E1C2_METRM|nr:PHP-associated domain-containing protein [Methanobrevibacter ruminantium]ADC48007.1 PHP domain-containing protein [Methanobrevibacter ruminantium M1]